MTAPPITRWLRANAETPEDAGRAAALGAEGAIPACTERHVLDRSPCGSVDEQGVGELIEIALARDTDAKAEAER